MKQQSNFITAALLLLIAVIGVYANHFDNPFQFDDSHTIVNNIYIRDLHNIPRFFKDGTTFSSLPANQSYRPVVTTTLAIDYWLGKGLNPFWFHLSTFIWFLVQGVLMFYLFLKIMNIARPHEWNRWFALLTVGWYMLHTVNAETINYIISRSDSLSTLAIVAALYTYVVNGWGRKYFLYLIPLGLGVLTKPTSIMFIGILGAYIVLFETDLTEEIFTNKINLKKHTDKFIHLGVTLVFAAAGYKFMDYMTPSTWVPGGVSKFHYWITQPYVIFHYFQMFLIPDELSADTDWGTLDTIFDMRFFIGVLFIMVLCLVIWFTIRKRSLRPIAFGLVWFLLALIPTSLIPLAEVMNDHRMFFPFVGLVLSAGWALSLLAIKYQQQLKNNAGFRNAAILCITIVLMGYGYGVYQRNIVWSSDITLWKDVAEKSPKNGRGLMNYGLALASKGKFKEALQVYKQALKLVPYYSYLHINMAITYDRLGDKQQAESHFMEALRVTPANQAEEATYFYGMWLGQQKRYNDAKIYLKRTLEISPAYLNARYTLMDVLLNNNEPVELKQLCDETLRIVPNDPTALKYLASTGTAEQRLKQQETAAIANPTPESLLDLSLVYYKAGDYQKTIETCERAIKLKPNFPEAYNNICSAYNNLKQWDKAIEACNKAIELQPNFSLAKNNLAWAKSQK